jgi:hypothetical protein
MDPKMDSGLLIPDKDTAVDNFDPLQNMPAEEIIGIMDQLLSFEVRQADYCAPMEDSDASSRWPGIRDTPSLRLCSHLSTCTLCLRHTIDPSMLCYLVQREPAPRIRIHLSAASFEHSVSVSSNLAMPSSRKSPLSITTKKRILSLRLLRNTC